MTPRLVLKDGKIFGYLAIGNIDRAGIVTGMMKEGMNVEKFKEAIIEDDFHMKIDADGVHYKQLNEKIREIVKKRREVV